MKEKVDGGSPTKTQINKIPCELKHPKEPLHSILAGQYCMEWDTFDILNEMWAFDDAKNLKIIFSYCDSFTTDNCELNKTVINDYLQNVFVQLKIAAKKF